MLLLDDDRPLLLDACSALNLAAALTLERAGRELGRPLQIVRQAAQEVLYLYDDVDGERRRVTVDVTPLGIVDLSDDELDDFVALTGALGDGEAATLAAAKHRGWAVLTNDRVARRSAAALVPPVVTITTPAVLRAWSTGRRVPAADLAAALRGVEERASFVPRRNDPDAEWWRDAQDP